MTLSKFSILSISALSLLFFLTSHLSSPTDLEKLPNFEISILNSDDKLTDEELRGKYILIDVWSTYCGSCIKAIPELKTLNKRYAGKNFQIVSIAYNTEAELNNFIDTRHKMPWIHAIASTDSSRKRIATLFKVRYTPTYYFVSPKGKIIANQKDFEEADSIKEIIDNYL